MRSTVMFAFVTTAGLIGVMHPFTLMDIRLNTKGEGEGKMSCARRRGSKATSKRRI